MGRGRGRTRAPSGCPPSALGPAGSSLPLRLPGETSTRGPGSVVSAALVAGPACPEPSWPRDRTCAARPLGRVSSGTWRPGPSAQLCDRRFPGDGGQGPFSAAGVSECSDPAVGWAASGGRPALAHPDGGSWTAPGRGTPPVYSVPLSLGVCPATLPRLCACPCDLRVPDPRVPHTTAPRAPVRADKPSPSCLFPSGRRPLAEGSSDCLPLSLGPKGLETAQSPRWERVARRCCGWRVAIAALPWASEYRSLRNILEHPVCVVADRPSVLGTCGRG